MASQSQASQSDVDDQRFAELLKPIKDLTQNWEVKFYFDVLTNIKKYLCSGSPG